MDVDQSSDPAERILGSPFLLPVSDSAAQGYFATCDADLNFAGINPGILGQGFIHVVLNQIIRPLITERSETSVAWQTPGATAKGTAPVSISPAWPCWFRLDAVAVRAAAPTEQ